MARTNRSAAAPEISLARRWMVRSLVPVWIVVIHGAPAVVLLALSELPETARGWALYAASAPVLYLGLLPLTAGILSRLSLYAMVPGRFPRDLGHRIYGPRRLHGLCWTSVYYNPPAYHMVLALPWLRHLVLRLFGYSGPTDFTLYPDTWIRDLPLLSIGSGAYLSNRATISPNMCLKNGTVLVARVEIGAGALVGHAALVAPGVVVGPDAEIGTQTAVNVGARIGAGSRIGHCCAIDRWVTVGDGCRVAERSDLGFRAEVRDSGVTRFGDLVPARGLVEGKGP